MEKQRGNRQKNAEIQEENDQRKPGSYTLREHGSSGDRLSTPRHRGGLSFRWNRELTLKCKLKCYLNPWITHWALGLVKGNREAHEAKKNSFDLGGNRTHDLRIRSTVTLPTELQGRTEKVGDDFRWWIAAKRKYGYIWMLCRMLSLLGGLFSDTSLHSHFSIQSDAFQHAF